MLKLTADLISLLATLGQCYNKLVSSFAGDQNCIHVSTNDNARQYGWLTARFPQAADQCTRSCAVVKAHRPPGMTREELSR